MEPSVSSVWFDFGGECLCLYAVDPNGTSHRMKSGGITIRKEEEHIYVFITKSSKTKHKIRLRDILERRVISGRQVPVPMLEFKTSRKSFLIKFDCDRDQKAWLGHLEVAFDVTKKNFVFNRYSLFVVNPSTQHFQEPCLLRLSPELDPVEIIIQNPVSHEDMTSYNLSALMQYTVSIGNIVSLVFATALRPASHEVEKHHLEFKCSRARILEAIFVRRLQTLNMRFKSTPGSLTFQREFAVHETTSPTSARAIGLSQPPLGQCTSPTSPAKTFAALPSADLTGTPETAAAASSDDVTARRTRLKRSNSWTAPVFQYLSNREVSPLPLSPRPADPSKDSSGDSSGDEDGGEETLSEEEYIRQQIDTGAIPLPQTTTSGRKNFTLPSRQKASKPGGSCMQVSPFQSLQLGLSPQNSPINAELATSAHPRNGAPSTSIPGVANGASNTRGSEEPTLHSGSATKRPTALPRRRIGSLGQSNFKSLDHPPRVTLFEAQMRSLDLVYQPLLQEAQNPHLEQPKLPSEEYIARQRELANCRSGGKDPAYADIAGVKGSVAMPARQSSQEVRNRLDSGVSVSSLSGAGEVVQCQASGQQFQYGDPSSPIFPVSSTSERALQQNCFLHPMEDPSFYNRHAVRARSNDGNSPTQYDKA